MQLAAPADDEYAFSGELDLLFDQLWSPGMAVRLVGVAVSGFDDAPAQDQLSLFDAGQTPDVPDDARRNLLGATDKVKERFGEGALRFGRELRLRGQDTGSSAKNPADYR